MSRINSNIASLQAQHTRSKNNADLDLRLTRLSTGLRINTGKDDPAGLIASETLRSEIAGLNQAVDNTTRASNVINTAEGALNEVSSLLLEVQSLTNEAANNGALSPQEIEANQLQVDSILNSVNRIANTTQFNGIKLLNGSLDYQLDGVAASSLNVVEVNAAKLPDNGPQTVTVAVTGSAQFANLAYTGSATVGSAPVTIAVGGIDGVEQLSFAAGTTTSNVALAINQVTAATGVTGRLSGAALVLESTRYGSKQYVSVEAVAGTFPTSVSKDFGQDATVSVNGTVAEVDGLTATARNGALDATIILDPTFGTAGTGTTSFDIAGGGAKFQLGSIVNRQSQINVGIGGVSTAKLGDNIDGHLAEIASGGTSSLVSGNTVQAQKILTTSIKQIASLRGRLGAVQKNVLDTNINTLQVAVENVTASESNIRDADFAAETAALTRAQILVQANTSILQQANSSPQSVLSLLQ